MIVTKEEYSYREPLINKDDVVIESSVKKFTTYGFLTEGLFSDIAHNVKAKSEEDAKNRANVKFGAVVPAYRKYLELFMQHQEDILKNLYDYCLKISKNNIDENGVKQFIKDRDAIQAKVAGNGDLLSTARNLNTVDFYKACQKSPDIAKDLESLAKDCSGSGKYIKRATKMADDFEKIYKLIEKIDKDDNFSDEVTNWIAEEYNVSVNDYDTLKRDIVTPSIIYNKLKVVDECGIIREAAAMNESLFKREIAPDFNKAAVDFFKKLDKKCPLKKRDFESIIKKKEKSLYNFEIAGRTDKLKGYAAAAGQGAVAGLLLGPMGGVVAGVYGEQISASTINKEKNKMLKVIESCGIKLKYNNPSSYYERYMYSKDKEFIFVAWPAITSTDGKNFTSYSVSFSCVKMNERLRKMLSESTTEVSEDDETFIPSKYFSFQDEDKVNPSLFDDEKVFYRDPVYNKAITEYFNMTDRKTTKVLTRLNEAGQNTVLMNLTSKLYDKIVSKCDDIDYGEIPATKGDITKLSKYNDMKETISIMHDILKEYNQDTGPVDELSVALSNVEARKDLFERAYRYNSELPIAMYCNVVLGIITGISYMIATSIEFIKDPGTESFRIALDKMSYAKTKDHMIYSTLKSFNKTCANKDFDRAMEAVLKASTKNFTGGVVLGGIAIGILGVILVLIPVLRELIFLFYYTRMRISDFFDIQADLLQANAYALESNTTLNKTEQKKVMAKQLKTVEHFRKISNAFAIEIKKAEVSSAKEKRQDDETKMLIDDIDGLDSSSGSALF